MSETLFELERATDRAEIAAVLGAFADALGDDRSAVFDTGEGALAVDVPDRTVLDVELEREDDPPTVELEFELEWDERPDEPTVRAVDAAERTPIAAAEPPSTAGAEPDVEADAVPAEGEDGTAADADPSAPSPASSVAPPDAVAESDASAPDADAEGETATPGADAEDEGDGRRSRFEVYRDRAGEWRWRLVHWNGNVIADSGEGYASRRNAERGLRSVMRNAPGADVERRE